jgi:hypothetical protein
MFRRNYAKFRHRIYVPSLNSSRKNAHPYRFLSYKCHMKWKEYEPS